MTDRKDPYEGMNLSDRAAVNQEADDELEYDDIDLASDDPTD
jgi:hypothetical protein